VTAQRWWCVCALILGCSAQGATAGDAGVAGCVSIAIPDDDVIGSYPIAVPLKGGVWRTRSGIHAAWAQWIPRAKAQPPAALHVATFTPETGALIREQTYDLAPSDATGFTANGAAGLEDGTFAVSYFWTGGATPSWGKVIIGNVDDPTKRVNVDLQRAEDWRGPSDVTWDGEAFTVHAWEDGVTQALFVARISPAGELVLPLTQYGKSPAGGFAEPDELLGGFTLATDAVSGRTFHFDPRAGQLLNGHERHGTRLPWTPVLVEVPDTSGIGSDLAGSRTDGEGGVWLAWDGYHHGYRNGTAAHVTAAGSVEKTFSFELPKDDPAWLRPTTAVLTPVRSRPGLLADGRSRVQIFTTNWERIYEYDYDGQQVSKPTVLFEDRHERNEGCSLLIWNLGPFAWGDERWLSFIEDGGGGIRRLRIVRVQDGCRYSNARPAPVPTCARITSP
jgi:hypothetical protein